MSAPSVMRSLASSSRQGLKTASHVSRRTLIGDASPRSKTTMSGANVTVDPRVLNGVPDFLPKENIDRLCEWQAGLWKRLQEEVRNKPELLEVRQRWDRAGVDVTALLTQTAREPTLARAFNYASLLLNNSYFLETLNAAEERQEPLPQFASLEEKFVAYAEGMVGSGWLWLVRTNEKDTARTSYDVFPSFSSGTLLVTNRMQRGRDDLAVFGAPSTSGTDAKGEEEDAQTNVAGLGAGKIKPQTQVQAAAPGRPVPLAVLNMFELSYLGDKYGVWSRGDYARDWFRRVNWKAVGDREDKVLEVRSTRY